MGWEEIVRFAAIATPASPRAGEVLRYMRNPDVISRSNHLNPELLHARIIITNSDHTNSINFTSQFHKRLNVQAQSKENSLL